MANNEEAWCGFIYSSLMRVRVLYMGLLKEVAGRDSEELELRENSRVGDLFSELKQRIPKLSDFGPAIAVAVNYEYSGSDAILHQNDEVALLPPVSGGNSPSG